MLTEIRYAFRSLQRRSAFALAAIVTIALGVGANTAVFHIIYSVLIQPLPFREPDRLVQLWESTPALPQLQVTVPDFEDWRKSTHSFEQIAAYTFQVMNKITLVGQGEPEIVHATMASHELLPMLGIQPILGRPIKTEEQWGQRRVALISEDLWRRKFNADPAILGRALRLETLSFTVIGVVPRKQTFPEWADLWIPFSLIDRELQQTRKYHPLEVVARLKPGVSLEQAQAEVQSLSHNLSQVYPATNKTVSSYVIPLSGEITHDIRPSLLIVWAAVSLVLVIACANLAHLVLARLTDRKQEMAIRASLGADRGRLVRQILLESLLLAIAGGALGALLAAGVSVLLQRLATDQIPRMDWTAIHGPVWIFAIAVAGFCCLLFGLPACWQALKAEANLAQGRGSVRAVTQGHSRFGSLLMIAEIAFSFLVLAGAVLLTRSFIGLLDEAPGFQSRGVLVVDFPMPSSRYDGNQTEALVRTRVIPPVHALPGVVDVAAANSVPMSLGRTEHSRFATRFGIEGQTYEAGRYPVAQYRWVSPEYFRVLGIPLKKGRFLTKEDLNQPRYMINETLARRFISIDDPTRKRLVLGVVDPQQQLNEIVGVVGDVREFGLDEEVPPTLYVIGSSPYMNLVVRTFGDPLALAPAIRRIIHVADAEVAVTKVKTLDEFVKDSLARRRFAVTLLSVFAGLAAFLTGAGIYGVFAYSVSRRVREFGIRAAIGATPRDLLRMILGEAATVALPGLVGGLALALAFARLMRSLVYRLSPMDPPSLATAGAFLIALSLLSAWLPAGRAARVDPSTALRQE